MISKKAIQNGRNLCLVADKRSLPFSVYTDESDELTLLTN